VRRTSAAAGREPTVRGLDVPEAATSRSTRPSVLPFVIRALPRAPGLLVALCRSLCALPLCALTAIPSSISLCPLLAPRARPLLPRPHTRTVGALRSITVASTVGSRCSCKLLSVGGVGAGAFVLRSFFVVPRPPEGHLFAGRRQLLRARRWPF